jgi:ABC-type sugar transport system permease subunit
LDGASYFAKLIYITLPSMKPIFFVLLLLNVLWTFKAFTIIYVLTKGGPYHSSEVIGVYAWLTAFFYNRPGLGSAVGVIIFLILLLFARVYLKYFKGSDTL